MDDVEMTERVRQVVAVLARLNGTVGERDLDALQECLRLAESVPGLREGLIQVRLAEGAARGALAKYGRHAGGCGRARGGGAACGCGLDAARSADTGPDLLAYLLLLRGLASALRRCAAPLPQEVWQAAGRVTRWEAAHRALLRLLDGLEESRARG
jgi:hypothetical protein